MNYIISKIFIFIVFVYQRLVSPLRKSSCRYYPTCSEYTRLHIQKHGFYKSCFPVLKRIFSCHPFSNKSPWYPVK